MDDLIKLQTKIWEHYGKGGDSAPVAADKVGGENSGQFGFGNKRSRKRNPTDSLDVFRFPYLSLSGAKGEEYPSRFFARDYANNRLEFSL